ncbi:nuclear receptor-interacting protein 1 [Chanos chanos]|uniref:Nuclear receptor-interacting protein 1 n=1 Tax=Chanos chanos TaxID=29144 RepID=A0A6J2VJI7_CHACN|nr:nuclear receptor-interacting protein 1-like [Chanos chanos]
MTHGEETGSETHQDTAVLTYLEGLLMHRVAGAQGATATQRCDAGHDNQGQDNKGAGGVTQPNQGPQQEQDKAVPHGGSSQHLKKARLLCSEAWTEQKKSGPPVELRGQNDDDDDDDDDDDPSGLNGSPNCKGESTLLANLLQSFSSRLQNVALSQQIVQSLRQQDASSQISKAAHEDKTVTSCHRPASNHLKGLIKKSKTQNHINSVPYPCRPASQDRLSESPKKLQSNAQSSASSSSSSSSSPSSDSMSCAERLKAVANLVNIRSSPAPSPKPSVACSQLALLLSSEAHLQQYSREHALKAQLSGRSASQRLAAMATQHPQDKKQTTTATQPQMTTETLSSLRSKNGTPPQMSTSSGRLSLTSGQSLAARSSPASHHLRGRRPFERHGSRPTPNCSSLLLQLLNNHNTKHCINGQGHLKEDSSTLRRQESPSLSDSEHSNPDSSLHSDAESVHSTCSPIDLSLKNRASAPTVSSSSSPVLDKPMESQLNRLKPETPHTVVTVESRDLDRSPEMKPHHKVTLLELLLDHKNNEKVNKGLLNPDLQPAIIPKASSASTVRQAFVTTRACEEKRTMSPLHELGSRSPQILPTFPHRRDSNSTASPYIIYGSPPAQSMPLDLCKNKPLVSKSSVKGQAFSASKLLQNLAQCGKQIASPSPLSTSFPPGKRKMQELNVDHSATLLERLTAPVQRNNTPASEGTQVRAPVAPESSQNVSEIENLLERRTVLQLLLGNASQKERTDRKRKRDTGYSTCFEKQPNQTNSLCHLNGAYLNVPVKTEAVEEDHESDNGKETKECQSVPLEAGSRQSQNPLSHKIIKQEPLSPEVMPKDGILSHLLKQQAGAIPQDTPEDSNHGITKIEPHEYQGPTIPKKRKFSVEPEDHFEVCQSGGTSDRSCNQKISRDCSTSGRPESLEPKEPSSPPEADSPPARFPPVESPPSDSQGFNVLKQLLLSDNCLKELSQPRSTFSPPMDQGRLDRSTIKTPRHNSELMGFQKDQNHSKISAGLEGNTSPESPRGALGTRWESPKSKAEAMKEDTKDSVKGEVGGEEKQDCQPDSPRLTKANPILYYMLQRGNVHLVKESREYESGVSQCRMQLKVKEETVSDTEAFDYSQNLKQNSQNHKSRDTARLNGSLKKS